MRFSLTTIATAALILSASAAPHKAHTKDRNSTDTEEQGGRGRGRYNDGTFPSGAFGSRGSAAPTGFPDFSGKPPGPALTSAPAALPSGLPDLSTVSFGLPASAGDSVFGVSKAVSSDSSDSKDSESSSGDESSSSDSSSGDESSSSSGSESSSGSGEETSSGSGEESSSGSGEETSSGSGSESSSGSGEDTSSGSGSESSSGSGEETSSGSGSESSSGSGEETSSGSGEETSSGSGEETSSGSGSESSSGSGGESSSGSGSGEGESSSGSGSSSDEEASSGSGSSSGGSSSGGSSSGGTSNSTTPSTGGGATGTFPTAAGESTLSAPMEVTDFDGGMVKFGRGVSCSSGEGGESDAVFLVADGGSLSNVIIGADQIEGVHCAGACTITNVWWEAVCEDALSFKGDGDGTVSGGGAKGAKDKVVQHNGVGTVSISDFTVEDFGKLYRSCGNCKAQGERHVKLSGIKATGGSSTLVGINSNFGDTATITNSCITGTSVICQEFEGTSPGNEPQKISDGPSSACIYTEADISAC